MSLKQTAGVGVSESDAERKIKPPTPVTEMRSQACKAKAKTAARTLGRTMTDQSDVFTAHSKVPIAPGELGIRYDRFATETACHGPIAFTAKANQVNAGDEDHPFSGPDHAGLQQQENRSGDADLADAVKRQHEPVL